MVPASLSPQTKETVGFSPPVAVKVPFKVAVDAVGAMLGETVLLAFTSPRVGAERPERVAKVPAELVHFKVPPIFSTAKR